MSKLNKECIAMLLAGGQGTRLGALTDSVAKPAVPFGGKYRIIDFTLSNTVNSGIDTIGVLTQYQPFELNHYIGNGQPWDLDRLNGGVFVLPPYTKSDSGQWYKGTANAIYQNINFVDRYNPQYVLVLSGDHIYKMDYSYMLASHKEKKADCTIAVINVPIEIASSFGIMNINKDNSIYEFEEKPSKPKSTMASMGIYIFTWNKLKHYLIQDEAVAGSSNDFGKNIIPNMLKANERMFAYEYKGYWKDVGTISSLWESNMDLLNPESGINLSDSDFKIYARNTAEPPHYVGNEAKIVNSIVSEGCEIYGTVINSIIFKGTKIEKGAIVCDSVVMGDCVVKNCTINHSIIGQEAVIENDVIIGSKQTGKINGQWMIATIAPKLNVCSGTVVEAGVMYRGGNK